MATSTNAQEGFEKDSNLETFKIDNCKHLINNCSKEKETTIPNIPKKRIALISRYHVLRFKQISTATMNLRNTATTTPSVISIAGVSVLLLQLLSILQIPVGTNGNVLSNRPTCEGGCYCLGSEGNCPPIPTITDSMLPMYRALTHANPMVVSCDPFQASTCVSTLEEGEACVLELIAPNATSGSSCPTEYSYQ